MFDLGERFSEIMCSGEDREKLELCESLVFRLVGSNKGEVEIDEVRLSFVFFYFFFSSINFITIFSESSTKAFATFFTSNQFNASGSLHSTY